MSLPGSHQVSPGQRGLPDKQPESVPNREWSSATRRGSVPQVLLSRFLSRDNETWGRGYSLSPPLFLALLLDHLRSFSHLWREGQERTFQWVTTSKCILIPEHSFPAQGWEMNLRCWPQGVLSGIYMLQVKNKEAGVICGFWKCTGHSLQPYVER